MTSTPLKDEALMSKQASLQLKFRRKRFGHFLSLLKNVTPYEGNSIRILDIGGTESYWKMVNFSPNQKIEITLLNLNKVPVTLENFESIVLNQDIFVVISWVCWVKFHVCQNNNYPQSYI